MPKKTYKNSEKTKKTKKNLKNIFSFIEKSYNKTHKKWSGTYFECFVVMFFWTIVLWSHLAKQNICSFEMLLQNDVKVGRIVERIMDSVNFGIS